ncbi:PIN domain-containing protein [Acidicapsa dinghuensis]|uniref:PIN domain-containing protein n=1 Tax=Acidicapsa dinghuensis TaxID=2218256 RepID=A0ABW1E9L3_9BACT|nr:PIN domain-containing protein [Acidicapsa dinghuensis]
MIVLDANILIRAILGRRVRQILEDYSAAGVRFYAPDLAFEEAAEYLPVLLNKKGISGTDGASSIAYLEAFVRKIDVDAYKPFEGDARLRLRRRDEDDWPILASALALNCPIWTEDMDFFGSGIAVWTTNRVELFLKTQSKA